MPIEDVDYLRQVSIKQSYIFLVDSIDRDHITYPTPSQYVVNFTTPFQNVVGLEVLDASIPRTMYNVDVPNCTIRMFIHDDRTDAHDTSKYVTRTIQTGDYTIQTLLPALTETMKMHLNGDPNEPEVSITAETISNPPETKSIIRFRCPYPFSLSMDQSTLAETLGFDLFVQPSEADEEDLQRRYQPLFENNRVLHRIFHSVDLPASIAMGGETIVFDGPRGVVRKLALAGSESVAQRFTVKSRGYFTQLFAALTTADGTTTASSRAIWELYSDMDDKPYELMATGQVPISFTDGGLSDMDTPSRILLQPGNYWVRMLSAGETTYLFYNDVPTTQYQGAFLKSSNDGTSWSTMDTAEGIHFEASIRVIVQDEYHQVVAPGMYSLLGEKYVVLRCPEIEENSYRSLAFAKYCLGLAKFKLGVVGYSENRVDFSRTPLREFHPIGRLSRLSLRFETASGRLYDFKGVNHNITFAIHYLEPVQKKKFEQSILNPNYRGDVLQYHYHHDSQEEDSDDQESDYGNNELEDYKLTEAANQPDQIRENDLRALFELTRHDFSENL